MDATMLTVVGTGLTVAGTGIALFVALWKVQGQRFDAMDRRMQKRFEASDQRSTERFEGVTQRFEMAEKMNHERFEMAERQNQAAHAAICESIGRLDDRVTKLDDRTRADSAALHLRFDA